MLRTRSSPGFEVEKTTTTPTITTGNTASYTITVTNLGPGVINNVTLSDTLPGTGWSITGPTTTGAVSGLTCSIVGGVLGCTATQMGAPTPNPTPPPIFSAFTSFSLTLTRTSTITDFLSIQNTAVVSSSDTQDTSSGNNTSGPIQITVTCLPVLTIAKTPDVPTDPGGQITAGETATFTIVLTNNGPGTAVNVVISDTLPGAGLTWTKVAGAASCTVTSNVLTCNIPSPAWLRGCRGLWC